MGANEKVTEKENEVKEFVSRGTNSNLKKRAAKARHSYAKKSMRFLIADFLEKQQFLSLLAYAAAVIAVILISVFICKIPVVAVCCIVVIETLLAACLHNLPIWLHALVIIAEVICGIIFEKILFMVLEALLYLSAILALKVIRK